VAAAAEPVNRRLASDVERGAGIDVAAAAGRLRLGGPGYHRFGTGAGHSRRDGGYSLDVLDDDGGTGSLRPGIFAEDAKVPVTVAAMLRQGTAAPARTHLTIMPGLPKPPTVDWTVLGTPELANMAAQHH
jgi:hypothetical protein